jgi:3-phenylpropionate/trans-cinnamate dioxygenase ferredoxin reductase subunit
MSHKNLASAQLVEVGVAADVRRIVVVGGGPAAHRSALELRKLGFTGLVTMISSEPVPPYDRTLLSKDNLCDAGVTIASLATARTYEELGIDLRLGREAISLDATGRTIRLADGASLDYDRLILAVGGAPVLPRALAAPGVLTMRRFSDVAPMRDALERSRHVVVIGAGFIGGEIASAAAGFGCGVTLVEAGDVPLEPVLGRAVGARVGDLHRTHGIDLRCGTQADRVLNMGDRYQVDLRDGTQLWCDSVIVGVGMRPCIAWLRASGIRSDRAILTDSLCRTSLPGVFAAGDCAQWWSNRYGAQVHVEHWDTAGKHGAAAARSALGMGSPFDPIPFFWSDQYNVKYQWAGYAPVWDRVDISGDGPEEFTARYLLADRLVGAFVANRPKEFAELRRSLLSDVRETSPAGKEVVSQ